MPDFIKILSFLNFLTQYTYMICSFHLAVRSVSIWPFNPIQISWECHITYVAGPEECLLVGGGEWYSDDCSSPRNEMRETLRKDDICIRRYNNVH